MRPPAPPSYMDSSLSYILPAPPLPRKVRVGLKVVLAFYQTDAQAVLFALLCSATVIYIQRWAV